MSLFTQSLAVCTILAAQVLTAAGSQRDLIDIKSAAAVKRFSASAQPDAAVKYENGKIAFVLGNTPKTPWAGVAVKPAGGEVWNLADCGYIDVNITNPNKFDIQLYARVDDSSKLIVSGAWITAQQKIKANTTETIRIHLADLSYGRKYILQRDQISQILLFGGPKDTRTSVILNSITTGGKAGETPAWFLPLLSPEKDGVLADFAGNSNAVKISPLQAESSKKANSGLDVSFKASAGSVSAVLINPDKAKWNLSFFNQVDFYLSNPTGQPQSVICAVNNNMNPPLDNCASEKAVIPPGAKMKVTVSFIGKEPWQSFIQSNGKAKTTDAASERTKAAGDKGGQDLSSDEVSAVTVASGDTSKPGEIIIEKIIASVAAPDRLPEWSGTRPPVPGNWTQTLNENFDGDTINEALWNKKMPWVGLIPNELQRYNPNNISVKDGMLHLRAAREKGYLNGIANPAFPEGKYTSAVVTTHEKWSQAYGYFEARLKPQTAIGVWPAFWGMPFHGLGPEARRIGTTRGGAEIDIFEHPTRFGPYRTNIAVHWDNYGADHKKTGISRVYYTPDKDGFVTSGLLWEPGKLTWFINQKVVGVWESPAVPTVAIYLKLTIQMGNWGGFIVEDDKLTQQYFLIDYVRAWQRDDLKQVNKK